MRRRWPRTGRALTSASRTEAGHHRIEHRQIWVVSLNQVPNLPNHKKWKGLASIVMVRRRRLLWNKETERVCYYITSLDANAAFLAQAIRSHWGIENSLHWVERCDLQRRPQPYSHGTWAREYDLVTATLRQFNQTGQGQRQYQDKTLSSRHE